MELDDSNSVQCDGCAERVLAVEIRLRSVRRPLFDWDDEVRLCLLCAAEFDQQDPPRQLNLPGAAGGPVVPGWSPT